MCVCVCVRACVRVCMRASMYNCIQIMLCISVSVCLYSCNSMLIVYTLVAQEKIFNDEVPRCSNAYCKVFLQYSVYNMCVYACMCVCVCVCGRVYHAMHSYRTGLYIHANMPILFYYNRVW